MICLKMDEFIEEKIAVELKKPTPDLSEEQQHALGAIHKGRNVFITGSAGVGKSFLLNQILQSLPRNIGVTASTGVAACNIGGTTLHSFVGIGLGEKSVDTHVGMIRRKKDVYHRLTCLQVLVIDEVSMIDGVFLEKLDQIIQLVRRNKRPFGGIQMIFIGDFLQLPPVKVKRFSFESNCWKNLIDETICLKKVFRQKQVGFVALLNRLRYGMITSLDIEVLHLCRTTIFPEDGIRPTRLYPLRWLVERDNENELKKLRGESYYYQANDWSRSNYFDEQLQKNSKLLKDLTLKVGAQVMLLINKDVYGGLVNGARGVVVGFTDSQGKSDDETTDGESDCKKNNKTINLIKYPIVKFVNGKELCILPEKLSVSLAGEEVAWRNQIPLALAWAVSIHKSQGMTMERVDANLSNVFEHGQSYVALSRVTSLDGLLLRDFDPARITAHPSVLKYYKQIDPEYENSLKQGTDELKDFIKLRKDPERYRRSIEDMVPIKCESDTDLEHDYSIKSTTCDSTDKEKTKLLRVQSSNILESPGRSHYVRINGVCRRKQEQNDNIDFTDSLKGNELNNNKDSPSKTNTESSNDILIPAAFQNAKSNNCRQIQSESQQVSSVKTACSATKYLNSDCTAKTSAVTTNQETIYIDSDSNDEACSTKSGKRKRSKSQRLTGTKRKSVLIDNIGLNKTVVEESDPEDLIEPRICEDIKTPDQQRLNKKLNFFSTICSDLIQCSKPIQTPKKSHLLQTAETTDADDEKIKAMLKEKEVEIQEKRRKALERRLQSLKRGSHA